MKLLLNLRYIYMNINLYKVALLCMLIVGNSAHAQTVTDDMFSAFQSKATVSNTGVIVPTVIEVPFISITIDREGFLVQEIQTRKLIPSYFKNASIQVSETLVAQSVAGTKSQFMVDGNPLTAVSFPILQNGSEETDIRIDSNNPITTSQLTLTLPANVTLPIAVAITARDIEGVYQTVVAKKRLASTIINFPETTSGSWRITLEYEQPLRIAELAFTQDNLPVQAEQSLRFLAQKGMSYDIFYNPDQPFTSATAESGDLRDDTNIRTVEVSQIAKNALYVALDSDDDEILDVVDNCPLESNFDQEDIDENSIGDICDDYDRDAILNNVDNCADDPNMSQSDEDGDGIGDVCDDQESRITERYMWVPWVGMGIAFLVLIVLFILVGTKPKQTPTV